MNLRPRFLLLALLLGLVPGALWCQDRAHSVEEQLRQFRINRSLLFNYDLYQFAGTSRDSTRLDVIITVVNDLLQFVKESESHYRASFEITLTIVDDGDGVISDQTFRKEFTAKSYRETNSQTAAHAFYTSFALSPGNYELLLELTDLDIRKSLRRSHPVQIKSFAAPLTISNAVVSTTQTTNPSPELMPFSREDSPAIGAIVAPRSLLSPFLIGTQIHYQVSTPMTIYHEFTGDFDSDTLMLSYRLLDSSNEAVWKTTKKTFSPPMGRFVFEVTLDPTVYDPGLYRLEVFARNRLSQELSEIPIYINRVLARVEDETEEIDEVGPLRYITSPTEFEDLSAGGQDGLISTFWEVRDPTPGTAANELKSEFSHRVRFANRNFVSLIQGRKGWETDQGKAYILYGPPSEIFHPSVEENVFQHEIWVYDNQQLKTRFVFVFKPEKGEYELISRG